jgi:hypothetical protein
MPLPLTKSPAIAPGFFAGSADISPHFSEQGTAGCCRAGS